MPTVLKTKNSVTTTVAPTSLAQGELAVNITDKKMWVGNAATTPVQLLGTGSSAAFGAVTVTSLTDSGLTAGRITYATTGGLLTDTANLTTDTNSLNLSTSYLYPLLSVTSTGNNAIFGFRMNNTGTGGTDWRIEQGRSAVGEFNISNQSNSTIPLIINAAGNSATFATALTASYFVPSSASVPSNGMFLPTTNTVSFSTNTTERMRITSTGQLVLGGTTASGVATRVLDIVDGTGTGGNASLNIFAGANLQGYLYGDGTRGEFRLLAGGTNYQSFYTNSTERMRIDSSGNVGIGTSSPATKLHVNQGNVSADTYVQRISWGDTSGTNKGLLGFYSNNGSDTRGFIGADNNGVLYLGENGGGGIRFLTGGPSGTERMRIDSSGNLLVGATSASTPSGVTSKIVSQGSFGAGAGAYGLSISSTTTGINQFYISFQTATTTERGYIWFNNAAGQVQLAATSDARLKENIVDAPSALPIIEQVKVRQYAWKDTGSTNIGFVAQELNNVIPKAVAIGEDNEDGSIKRTWGVDNATLVPYLVKAIQEQQSLITNLTNRLTALENA
jgi:hypothetical protein